MLLLPRLRLALARRPYLYWLFVAGCAAIVWSTIAGSEAKLDHERQRWGETRQVWVAAVDIAPGEVVRSVARAYPVAMVARSAIADEPVNEVATAAIAAGEVLVHADIEPTTDRILPAGSVVFALDRDNAPDVGIGDEVAVFGSGQRWCDGVVVGVDDHTVEVGVPATCAEAISVHVSAGSVVLAAVTR